MNLRWKRAAVYIVRVEDREHGEERAYRFGDLAAARQGYRDLEECATRFGTDTRLALVRRQGRGPGRLLETFG